MSWPKTGAARDRYNRVARTAHHLVHAWNAAGGTAHTWRTCVSEAAGGPTGEAPEELLRVARNAGTAEFTAAQLEARVRQFVDESWVHVPAAADALDGRGSMRLLRSLRSQRRAELALENQITETVRLCSLARELGAVASSAFGAGFGGSVWAMLPDAHAERFVPARPLREVVSERGASGASLRHTSKRAGVRGCLAPRRERLESGSANDDAERACQSAAAVLVVVPLVLGVRAATPSPSRTDRDHRNAACKCRIRIAGRRRRLRRACHTVAAAASATNGCDASSDPPGRSPATACADAMGRWRGSRSAAPSPTPA